MDIDGDIRVWKDGEKVRARLCADGPEGPIVVEASAPLAPIRRRIVRALARRGVAISGDEQGYGATIESIARKKALKRLRVMAPSAFSKRGLASYIARGELMKRRRRRRALARAGQPVGAKAIGPVPPGGPPRPIRRRRRWRRLGRWARPLIPAALATTSAALTPFITRPSARPLPPAPPPPPRSSGSPESGQGSGSYGSPGGASSPDASDTSAEEEPAGDEDETTAPGPDADEAAEAQGNGNETDGEDAGDGDGADEGENADGSDDGGGEAEVGEEPETPLTRRHVHQALVLLHAARKHPKARRRVHQIVQLAGMGEPTAKKALTALKVAKRIKSKPKKVTAIKAKPKLALAPRVQPQKALAALTVQPSPALAAAPATSTTSTLRRWLDVFAPWRRGVG